MSASATSQSVASNTIPIPSNTRRHKSQKIAQEQSQAVENTQTATNQHNTSQTTDKGDSQSTCVPGDNLPRTRPQNKFRRPALDVGLDWQNSQREREDAAAARSEKKAESERRKADKLEHAHLRHSGIKRIAALEEAREQRDREEAENLNSTATAGTNLVSLQPQKGPVTPSHALDEPFEASQDAAGGLSEDEFSTGSEEVDDEEPAARQPKKVSTPDVVTLVASPV